jgi:hypothetical protein
VAKPDAVNRGARFGRDKRLNLALFFADCPRTRQPRFNSGAAVVAWEDNEEIVIASEAKQSRATLGALDCFGANAPRNDDNLKL